MSTLTNATVFWSEFLGTMVLLLFGNGVCAAVTLKKSGAKGAGWVMIAFGWGLAVYIGATLADASGGHLNPAVTICLAVAGKLSWSLVPGYLAGQMLGAMAGAILCYLAYKQLFDTHDEPAGTTGIFFTAPAGNSKIWAAVTEFIATSTLLLFVLKAPGGVELGALKYFGVAFIIVAIGFSLGTPTGYALNPVRDLGPRLVYAFLLPIRGKGSANWGYAWVPVVAPILAAIACGLLAGII